MGNIICIDLTKFNNEKLVQLAKIYKLSPEGLINDKKEGFAKVYMDIDKGLLVAFTYKRRKDEIVIADVFNEHLRSIPSVVVEKKQPLSEMTIDSILDKISKYGIESLSINEKNFLDNLK